MNQFRRWTRLCDEIDWLRRYRGSGEYAEPPASDDRRALLLYDLCDSAYAELVRGSIWDALDDMEGGQ